MVQVPGGAAAVRAAAGHPTTAGPRHVFTPLETVIRLHLPDLFPGMELDRDTVFRVTRNSEYEIDDDEVEDLLKTIEEEVRKRRRGAAVRLEIEADAPAEIEQFLTPTRSTSTRPTSTASRDCST